MKGLFPTVQRTGVLSLINHSKRPVVAVDPRKAPTIDEFIGRPSPLGNQWEIGKHGSRNDVCDCYDEWLEHSVQVRDPEVMERLTKIVKWLEEGHDVRLVCFCVPERCHGESVIKQVRKLQHEATRRKSTTVRRPERPGKRH